MKKWCVFIGIVVSMATVVAIVGYRRSGNMRDIAAMNLEALAQSEGVSGGKYVSFDFNAKYWYGVEGRGKFKFFPKYDICRISGSDGHQVYCTIGEGNCWNGTRCIPD